MAQCQDIELMAMPYVDGELAAPEVREVELHVRACDACRARLRAEQARVAALVARGEPVPERVRLRLATALDLEDRTRPPGRGPWLLPGAAAIAGLCALLLFTRSLAC